MKTKKVGLTYDLKQDWQGDLGDPTDMNAELDQPQTIDAIAKALESFGHEVVRLGNVYQLMRQIDDCDVDIVFNIAEGYRGRNRESEVPLFLEMKRIPFVGADALSMGITLDKIMAKKCFIADGVPTPRYFVADSNSNLKTLNTIGFPLIVKPRYEGSSKGLSEKSRVQDLDSLKTQVEMIATKYKQSALVEEFIKGTEFSVSVWGNGRAEALPVVQVKIDGKLELGDDFYTFSRLQESFRVEYIVPAPIPPALANKMQQIAIRAYHAVDCRDFGRVDFRVDEKGNPFVLEINPLPCLSDEDIFAFAAKAQGKNYQEMINKILEIAIYRNGLS